MPRLAEDVKLAEMVDTDGNPRGTLVLSLDAGAIEAWVVDGPEFLAARESLSLADLKAKVAELERSLNVPSEEG